MVEMAEAELLPMFWLVEMEDLVPVVWQLETEPMDWLMETALMVMVKSIWRKTELT